MSVTANSATAKIAIDRAIATSLVSCTSEPAIPQPVAAPKLTREQYIRRIAAGSPILLPEGAANEAIARGFSESAFALEVADFCARKRAEGEAAAGHEAEIAACAMSIAGSGSEPAHMLPSGNTAVDALAAQIAAS